MLPDTWTRGEIESSFAECATLSEVIARLERERSVHGEVICEIRVNGLLLREEDEVRFADTARSTIAELAIVTHRSTDLICQALRSVAAFLPNLDASCIQTSDVIRDGGLIAAHKPFRDIVEGCQWAVETLIHARGAASGIGLPLAQAERWHDAEKTLSGTVRELVAAFEAKDGALVADILEYEVPGASAIWVEAIGRELAVREQPDHDKCPV